MIEVSYLVFLQQQNVDCILGPMYPQMQTVVVDVIETHYVHKQNMKTVVLEATEAWELHQQPLYSICAYEICSEKCLHYVLCMSCPVKKALL